MAELTSIHWPDALALHAGNDAFRVAALQPHGGLTSSDLLGPHVTADTLQAANLRAHQLIVCANASEAQLILAPEYSIPPEFVTALLTKENTHIRPGALYVLPMSSMTMAQYDAFASCQGATVEIRLGALSRKSGRDSVNACAILMRVGPTVKALLQAKVIPAALEEMCMATGTEVFVIEGSHVCLCIATCADLNLTTNHALWCEALSRKSGGILFHPQWNPAPDFQSYETFWRESLGHEDGAKRMIFALNWARGSVIGASPFSPTIEWARSKVLRGRTLESSDLLQRELSASGMNVQRWAPGHGSTRRFELWHAADGANNIWLWDFVRPFANQPQAVALRQAGLQHATVQRWHFGQETTSAPSVSDQTGAFWTAMGLNGAALEASAGLRNSAPWDIDRFCSACRVKPPDEWLEIDPTERPSSPLECSTIQCAECPQNGRQCSRGRTTRYEAIGYASACVHGLVNGQHGWGDLQLVPVQLYPLNLADQNGRPAGWLFHGRGRKAHEVEKDATRLLEFTMKTADAPIRVLALQVDGRLEPNRIGRTSIDSEETEAQDILDPEHGRDILIQQFN